MLGATELVKKLFAKKTEEYFGRVLIGKTIDIKGDVVGVKGDINLDYYERAYVTIDQIGCNMKYFDSTKKENGVDLKSYFEKKVKNQKIKMVIFDSTFLSDEVFVICTLENGHTVDLGLGYCVSTGKFHLHLDHLLTEEEKKCFSLLRVIYINVRAVEMKGLTYENKSEIYERVLRSLRLENAFEYQFPDFYKLEKINKLFEPVHIDAIEALAEIERIIYI